MGNWQLATESSTCISMLFAAAERNQFAWTQLSRIYGPLVYNWVRYLGVPPKDTPDVCQEVFTNVFRHLAKFHAKGGQFRRWLWVIAKHKACDYHRRNRQPIRLLSGDLLDLFPCSEFDVTEPSDASGDMPSEICRRAFEQASDRFEPRTREIAWAIIVEDYSPAAAAARFGVSVESAYKAKSRVLVVLRELLSGLEPFEIV